MKTSVVGPWILLLCSAGLYGQATSTASRMFDLQVGGGFTLVKSDYYPQHFKGGAVYATLDFRQHFGAEIDFRQADAPQDPTYERTYEIGGRYHRYDCGLSHGVPVCSLALGAAGGAFNSRHDR